MGLVVPESQALDFDSVMRTGDTYVWRATREFALLGDLLAGVAWGAARLPARRLTPGAERITQYAEFLGAEDCDSTGHDPVRFVARRSLAVDRGARQDAEPGRRLRRET
jgi:hypothetical protein